MEDRRQISEYGDTLSPKYASWNGLTVRYDLLLEHSGSRSFYSVKVSISSTKEYAYAHDITGSAEYAKKIFSLLHSGFVTPCCLCEVVEDLLESIPDTK